MKKRYSVLTYIINNYEIVREVRQADPEAEYILVTDDQHLTSTTWQVIYDEELEGLSVFDKCYAIRFNCFKYCTTEICVRIDASIGLKLSLKPLIDIFEEGGYDVCLMPHPHRDNFLDEYTAWIEQRGYDRLQAERCLKYMQEKGYDFKYKGLFQCGFAIQRHCEVTDKIDKMVFSMLKELGVNGVIERNDQIPFSFVVNKNFSDLKVLPISSQILSSPYMQLYFHGKKEYTLDHLPDITKKDIHYMFNRQVECMYMLLPMTEENNQYSIKREYELLKEIRNLQNLVNLKSSICKVLTYKSHKHLRVIRTLIVLSVILTISLVVIIFVRL